MTFEQSDSQSLDATRAILPVGDSLAVANQKPDLQTNSAEATHQLVDAKILPVLALNHDHGADTTNQQAKPKDWTVAIDLMTDLGHGLGVDDKRTQLEHLASETKGKSVAFVVHAEVPDSDGLSSDAPDKSSVTDKADTQYTQNDAILRTDRFLIEDGKIVPLPSEKDENSAQDITSLLKDAANLAPSKHLGVILQTHGGGAQGIETNLGDVSLNDTVGAIDKGLKGGGHAKLDLLDYDACDMGSLKVLDASKKVASDVVASESMEFASTIPGAFDGQNLTKPMRALLDNSKMSGRELGDVMVNQLNGAPLRTGDGAGTPTLANFDMSKYGDFQKSLDHFGAALTKASEGGQAEALEKDVQSTIMPPTGQVSYEAHGRDLRAFTQQILDDSKAGSFGADNKALQKSSSELLTSMDKMVTSHHSGLPGANENVGGLLAPVPGKEILDSKVLASELSPLHRLADDITDIQQHYGLDMNEQQHYVAGVDARLHSLPAGVHTEGNENMQQLQKDRDALADAKNLTELTKAFNGLAKDVNAAGKSDLEKDVENNISTGSKMTQLAYFGTSVSAEGVAPHWDQFGLSLQKTEK